MWYSSIVVPTGEAARWNPNVMELKATKADEPSGESQEEKVPPTTAMKRVAVGCYFYPLEKDPMPTHGHSLLEETMPEAVDQMMETMEQEEQEVDGEEGRASTAKEATTRLDEPSPHDDPNQNPRLHTNTVIKLPLHDRIASYVPWIVVSFPVFAPSGVTESEREFRRTKKNPSFTTDGEEKPVAGRRVILNLTALFPWVLQVLVLFLLLYTVVLATQPKPKKVPPIPWRNQSLNAFSNNTTTTTQTPTSTVAPSILTNKTSAPLSSSQWSRMIFIETFSKDAVVPGGHFMDLAFLILVSSVVGGSISALLGVPGLVGMTWVGFAWGNLTGASKELVQGITPWTISTVSKIGLGIILARAGLSFNLRFLTKQAPVVLALGLLPLAFEATVHALIAHSIYGLDNYRWAFLVGFMASAIAPSVVVPGVLQLYTNGIGKRRGPCAVMLSAGVVDSVFAVWVINFIADLLFADGAGASASGITFKALAGPLQLLLGIVVGIFFGLAVHAGARVVCSETLVTFPRPVILLEPILPYNQSLSVQQQQRQEEQELPAPPPPVSLKEQLEQMRSLSWIVENTVIGGMLIVIATFIFLSSRVGFPGFGAMAVVSMCATVAHMWTRTGAPPRLTSAGTTGPTAPPTLAPGTAATTANHTEATNQQSACATAREDDEENSMMQDEHHHGVQQHEQEQPQQEGVSPLPVEETEPTSQPQGRVSTNRSPLQTLDEMDGGVDVANDPQQTSMIEEYFVSSLSPQRPKAEIDAAIQDPQEPATIPASDASTELTDEMAGALQLEYLNALLKNVDRKLAALWNQAIMPLLFSVLGMRIDATKVFAEDFFPQAILCLVVGVLVRMIAVTAVMGISAVVMRKPATSVVDSTTNQDDHGGAAVVDKTRFRETTAAQNDGLLPAVFTVPEIAFCALSWIGKASVQAALGRIALERIHSDASPSTVRAAEIVANTAALATLIFAPLAAVLMNLIGPLTVRWDFEVSRKGKQ